VRYQEQHLSIAASTNDQLAKTVAYSSLGRVHQLLGNRTQAVAYLTQGLCIAEALGRRDEEARIRNRLGLTLWSNGDLDGAQKQLEAATHLLETIRREARNTPDYKLSLFELQSSSYQVLQRVLVGLNRQDEALVVAERGRNRAFVDLLLERQGLNDGRSKNKHNRFDDVITNSLDQIKDIVNRQRASVLYYSVAAGFLYAWLIVPTKGVVKFHSKCLNESNDQETCDNNDPIPSGTGILEKLVTSVRDSLGVELSPCTTIAEDQYSDDTLSERTGFLRMVNRQHLLNSSNYSLSSLFSLGSVGGSVASLQGSTRSSASAQGSTRVATRQAWKGPSCLHALYTLLIQPSKIFFQVKVSILLASLKLQQPISASSALFALRGFPIPACGFIKKNYNVKKRHFSLYSPPRSFSILSLLFHISFIHPISLQSSLSISPRSFPSPLSHFAASVPHVLDRLTLLAAHSAPLLFSLSLFVSGISPSFFSLSHPPRNFLCHTLILPGFSDSISSLLLVRVFVPLAQLPTHPSSFCSHSFHFLIGIPVPPVVLLSLSSFFFIL
jgi:hypothetical protein